MTNSKIIRRISLLFSFIMLLTSTVNTTYGFIVTKTDTLINIFKPYKSITNNLTISKTLEHPLGADYVIPENISFDFKINLGKLYANTVVATSVGDMTADGQGAINISIAPEKSILIEGLDEGTMVTVTETQSEGDGFTVKDGANIKEATVSADSGANVEFVNIYTPAAVQPVNLTVGGTKLLEGREWKDSDTFSFLLEQSDGSGNWLSLGTETVSFDANKQNFNKFDFSDTVQALTFDKVGIYTFRMTELVGKLENIHYDKTVNYFTVKITDTDMDGKLEIGDVAATQNAEVTKSGNGFAVDVIFNNAFLPPFVPDDISVAVNVDKSVNNTGSLSIPPKDFEFVLKNVSTDENLTVKTDRNGKAVFNLPFSSTDIGRTYTYKLSETNDGRQGVTYDADIYDISITIGLSSDNKLVASAFVNGVEAQNIVAEFENIYHNDPISSPDTSDNNNITFWFIIMITSGISCITLLLLEKKRKVR